MKYKIIILLLTTLLASCGLKKPLEDPDTVYPNAPDVEYDEKKE